MILAETCYEIYNLELLAIVEGFQTLRHYLESYWYEILVFIDYNNMYQFIDTKSLSLRKVYWAQELSR